MSEEQQILFDDEQPQQKSKLGRKKIILISAVLLIVGIGGGLGVSLMSSDEKPDAQNSAEQSEGEPGDSSDSAGQPGPDYLMLPEIIVNLRPSARASYLKTEIALLITPSARDRIKTMRPRLMEAFQIYLRQLDENDLTGSENIYRIRSELLRRARLQIGNDAISEVLIQSMVIQ